MKVQDFGHFDGPVVLFGGVYSNRQALLALIDATAGRDAICTGDIVGYCAEPNEAAALVSAEAYWSIAGNCERQLADGSEDCGCGFEDGSACSVLSRDWWSFLLKTATPDVVTWLHNLPDIGLFTQHGRRYAVLHGGATFNSKFIWPTTDEADFLYEIAALEQIVGAVDGIVAGHSGIAFQRVIDGRQWINAGAVGMPPHDGRPETRYAVLKNGDVTFERLSYDVDAAVAAMKAAGLVQGYEATLKTGIWPSEDVLP
ncbi:MAG: metallophosphoesterase family protein, partial [Boseongicola sp.]|nr:metallophosphoesterase family protein [Boseongicola sp.]